MTPIETALQNLQVQVQRESTIEASTSRLIQGLVVSIVNCGTTPEKLADLTREMRKMAPEFGAAIRSNVNAKDSAPLPDNDSSNDEKKADTSRPNAKTAK